MRKIEIFDELRLSIDCAIGETCIDTTQSITSIQLPSKKSQTLYSQQYRRRLTVHCKALLTSRLTDLHEIICRNYMATLCCLRRTLLVVRDY
jgi:hypothetical protein